MYTHIYIYIYIYIYVYIYSPFRTGTTMETAGLVIERRRVVEDKDSDEDPKQNNPGFGILACGVSDLGYIGLQETYRSAVAT